MRFSMLILFHNIVYIPRIIALEGVATGMISVTTEREDVGHQPTSSTCLRYLIKKGSILVIYGILISVNTVTKGTNQDSPYYKVIPAY